jgi:hypothetical protein
MICPTCRNRIPPEKLACPGCTEDRSRAALLAYQMDPLRKVAAGDGDLALRTVGATKHIQMFGADRAFCNINIPDKAERKRIPYTPEALAQVCGLCRHHFNRAMEAACPVSAS